MFSLGTQAGILALPHWLTIPLLPCLQAVNVLLCLQAMGLQQLVHNLLPRAPILGSSLPSDAWGTPAFVRRSLRGAVFLGSKAYDEGVAGCLLHGPLQVGEPYVRAGSEPHHWALVEGCLPVLIETCVLLPAAGKVPPAPSLCLQMGTKA